MIPKHKMTEEDIKYRYITPAIEKNWSKNDILLEKYFTDGRIVVRGNKTQRKEGKKADYLLYYKSNYPLAVVEAKDNKHSPDAGLQQAIDYAEILNIPFAYSSNGDCFIEHDMLTGKEREFSLDEFPSKEELWTRLNKAEDYSDEQLAVINEPYYYERGYYAPRYYQQIAVNKTVEAIAKGQNRVLLVMATGTGKTSVAFQLVYRLMKAGLKKRVLYLADRNILIDQAMMKDFSPLSEDSTKVVNREMDSSYKLHFALYQQLAGEVEGKEPFRQFQPDFFDLVIVDEAHRGSAKEESAWRKVLDYFNGPDTTHVGLTATPKHDKEASNIDYFGEPVYTYSLKQGIDDGFLAPYRVIRVGLDVDLEGYRPEYGKLDANGEPIPDREYNVKDFDRTLIIDDRMKKVAKYISDYLKQEDARYDKTIIFCVDINHAARMRRALINENSDLVKIDTRYVMQITGDNEEGKRQLDNFIDPNSKYPTLVTTSKLLTTGVDAKTCKLIVLDSNINSMTEFKQIIGRGTRLDPDHGKEFFTIMDFRNVTRLFSDPEFDGNPTEIIDVEGGEKIPPGKPANPPVTVGDGGDDGDEPDGIGEGRTVYVVKDREVRLLNDRIQYLDSNGKLITESLRDYTKKNILNQYATLDNFLNAWNEADKKQVLLEALEDNGVFLEELAKEENLQDMDEFDLIMHLAYDKKPLTKSERVNNVKKSGYLDKYQETAREIIEQLLMKYKDEGIEEIEDTQVLELQEFEKFGGPVKIIMQFGGKKGFQRTMKEIKDKIYS
ncbi:DEAD/DEAH box helicase family protein [Vagococcus lutrae]|uniref:EcoAI/FtnUII family type I restriction enzme subunit R n=1 Tax=Vagococcus lutrae TaxID=81947 RepID=UPI00200FD563|nr:DEAD/DEAH box helicase family protein [Vagococcus lutrae]UQF71801.1 DEAD/DEAH box helicase family protein [Vagococcus lutrae]